MPSYALDNKVPHSIWFPNEPLDYISPWVFDCKCFVHEVFLGLDKLLAQAIECVFLGYSHIKRGYQLFTWH